MRRLSAITGFTFPGMLEEPGWTGGNFSSPRPQRGPEPSQRTSLAIFVSAEEAAPSAPPKKTQASRPPICSKKFRAGRTGIPVFFARWPIAISWNFSWRPIPVPTAVPPSATSRRPS